MTVNDEVYDQWRLIKAAPDLFSYSDIVKFIDAIIKQSGYSDAGKVCLIDNLMGVYSKAHLDSNGQWKKQ